MNIQKYAEEIQGEITDWRRAMHQFPELGVNLPKTARYIAGQLDRMGISYSKCADGSGIVALIGKHNTGKTVGLRADMDGLPVSEKTGLDFASSNGNMHACGHDSHAAAALGAAKILKAMEDELPGRVKILFQPGEETLDGAKAMIKDGALENPKVDVLLAMHTMNKENVKNGSIEIVENERHVYSASSDAYIIRIYGKGGHAAMPENCVDPILPLSQLIAAIQQIVSREIAPIEPAVITISGVHAGNESFNVIPDYAELRGTYRTQNPFVRTYITKRLKELASAVCTAFRASCDVQIEEGVPSLVNSPEVLDTIADTYQTMKWKQDLIRSSTPLMGGEDAACFFEKVPGGYFMFLTNKTCKNSYYPVHNAMYDLDDEILYQASGLLAETIVNLMKK